MNKFNSYKWELVIKCPISEFPKMFWEQGPPILQATWKTKELRPFSPTKLLTLPKFCNPRLVGHLENIDLKGWDENTEPTTIVLSEYLHCVGNNNCLPSGKKKCGCVIRWNLYFGNQSEIEILFLIKSIIAFPILSQES